MSTRPTIFVLAAFSTVAVGALAPTIASASNNGANHIASPLGLVAKPQIQPQVQKGVIGHDKITYSPKKLIGGDPNTWTPKNWTPKQKIGGDPISWTPQKFPPNDWYKHHHHWWWWYVRNRPYYVVPEVVTTDASAPVVEASAPVVQVNRAPVVSANCNCLTKEYLEDGSVLFKDLCTKEAAIATPAELKAQAEGAARQTR
jgi:hypothetical protein